MVDPKERANVYLKIQNFYTSSSLFVKMSDMVWWTNIWKRGAKIFDIFYNIFVDTVHTPTEQKTEANFNWYCNTFSARNRSIESNKSMEITVKSEHFEGESQEKVTSQNGWKYAVSLCWLF